MRRSYTILYMNTDEVAYSEVIGIHYSLRDAVIGLLKAAHYDVDEDGRLRQYRRLTNEYESFDDLYNMVSRQMMLDDYDMYYIVENIPD